MSKNWTKYAEKHLLGKTVEAVRYLTQEELGAFGWYKNPLVIIFTDGTIIFPASDDEGNDGGSLWGQKGKESLTFPTL